MVRYSGILLVAFLLTHVGALYFDFSGRLSCPKRWFTYQWAVKWANCDSYNCHKFKWVTNYSEYFTSIAPHTYHVNRPYYNEGSSWVYQIFVSFYHTCTDTGEKVLYDVKFGEYENAETEKTITEVKNLKMLNMAKSFDKIPWDKMKNEEEE
ncbi:unnamed protein product [Caenorhabditis brenneri]